jgi:hypothetical protein
MSQTGLLQLLNILGQQTRAVRGKEGDHRAKNNNIKIQYWHFSDYERWGDGKQ